MPSKKDLSGMRFGRLVVIDESDPIWIGKQKQVMWNCICDCGNTIKVRAGALSSGNTSSCGCFNKDRIRETKTLDLTGKRFGMLVVKKMIPGNKSRVSCECMCDCGNTTTCSSTNLMQGKTTSCGCYKEEVTKIANYKHGESHTRLYSVWQGMRERCYNKNHISYELYGGRGIKVCDEWNNSYVAFKEWAENNGYDWSAKRGDCTLDRIDVNGSYSPDNCRFVDMLVQSNNRRMNS